VSEDCAWLEQINMTCNNEISFQSLVPKTQGCKDEQIDFRKSNEKCNYKPVLGMNPI